MAADERFDIYDEEGRPIGTELRRIVHERGLWHQTFHCWVVTFHGDIPYLLFQKRHSSKDTFPDCLDTSCAGHLTAGETVRDGVRELAEELGLHTEFEQLMPCGVYREVEELGNGWVDRELCHLFAVRCDRSLHEYRPQLEEVSGLYWIQADQIRRLLLGEIDAVNAAGIAAVGPDGTEVWQEHEWRAERKQFTNHGWEYYRHIFERLGELQQSIPI